MAPSTTDFYYYNDSYNSSGKMSQSERGILMMLTMAIRSNPSVRSSGKYLIVRKALWEH